MAWATISLPLPVSPTMRTAAGCRATFSASRITRCRDGLRTIRPESFWPAVVACLSSSFTVWLGEVAVFEVGSIQGLVPHCVAIYLHRQYINLGGRIAESVK